MPRNIDRRRSLRTASYLGTALACLAFVACTSSTVQPAQPDLAPAPDLALDPCITAKGCYSCVPTTDRSFLNQCTSSSCSSFDNGRLPLLLPGGKLPPLP
jgi:hypothetical protein